MNDPQDQNAPGNRPNRTPLGAKSKMGGIALALILAAYSFAAPELNTRFGWNLPQIRGDSTSHVSREDASGNGADHDSGKLVGPVGESRTAEIRDAATKSGQKNADSSASDTDPVVNARSGTDQGSVRTNETRSPGPLAGRMNSTSQSQRGPPTGRDADSATNASAVSRNNTRGSSNATEERSSGGQDDLSYGLLREISADRFMSPAGLLYTPGSAEGHRLEHLRRHTKNDPGRPGSHGVFDGGMEGALTAIDQAYDRAKKGQRTTKKTDQGRTIYTVDMGKRIGYVGGRDGGRRRNPMARRLRLVLEGNRVITAYPM
ncbi:MAG: hypothetical protein ACR2NZ_22750 [Rubripirellula sp.]